MGIASGVLTVNKFGRNTDIDTTTDPEDIWEGGGLYPFVTAAQVLQVSSASGDDASGGTGAKTVQIQGLDANWNILTETVTMSGISTVETTGEFIRVFRAQVVTAGTGGVNAGLITITYKTAATTAAVITAGYGQTLMAIYTVPAGMTGLLLEVYATINSSLNNAAGSRANISLRMRAGADLSTAPLQVKHIESIVIDGNSSMRKQFLLPLKVDAKTDIILRVDSVSDNDSDITGGFDILLIDNNTIDSWQ